MWETATPQAVYLTMAARLLMETRLICIGTSVAASMCSSSSGAVRLVRSSRCTISAARHTSVSLSEICKNNTAHSAQHCRTSTSADVDTHRLCFKLAFPGKDRQTRFELLSRAQGCCCLHRKLRGLLGASQHANSSYAVEMLLVTDLQGLGNLEGDEGVVGLAASQAGLADDRQGQQRVVL